MLFSSRVPLSNLIELCRALRHNLGAGLTLRDVFRQQSARGPVAVRPVAGRIAEGLAQGNDLESELERERGAFPPLFLSMASVGEQSGNLPEIFHELEKYYVLQQRLRKQFLAQSAGPIIRFIAAVFIIAGVIYILGMITESRPGSQEFAFDPVGIGLGPSAALTFLGGVFGGVLALIVLYFLLTRTLQQAAAIDRLLLVLPVIGPCVRALALARFSLALRLTLETGMSITQALRLTLRATGNAAFAAKSGLVEESLRSGDELTECLSKTRLFPIDYLNILATGEEGGRLTEVLEHQADYYQEEAARRLTILTQVAGWGVWILVAAFIVYIIFRFMLFYISLLDPARYGL